jgi:hypothetical protein
MPYRRRTHTGRWAGGKLRSRIDELRRYACYAVTTHYSAALSVVDWRRNDALDPCGHRASARSSSSDLWLPLGNSVYIHTGKGTNSGTHRYWGRSWYVWNNTGDTAYLRNPSGTLIDRCGWTSTGLCDINC